MPQQNKKKSLHRLIVDNRFFSRSQIHDDCSLALSFLDEVAGVEEVWTLQFVSAGAAEAVIKAIQPPWEELFSVPLQITNKKSDVNQQ